MVFLVAGVASFVLSGAQTYFTGWVGERALADLRIQLFRHLQRLSLGYYERNRTGAIVSRITNDVEALDLLVTDGISSLVQNSLVLAGTIVVLFILDWRLALATLIVLPLMGLATAWFRSRSNRAYKSVRERLGLVTATLAEDISGMRVVQSFTREPASQTTFRGVNERYREANFDTVVLNGIYFPAVDILSSVATAIVLGVGGWLVVEGNMTIGTLLAFTLYLGNFFDPVQQLSQLYNTFLSATAALDRITSVLDEEPDIVDAARRAARSSASTGTCASSTSASATATSRTSSTTSTSTLPAGTTVALVGHTGAGKSTIAKLLARFYDPRDGPRHRSAQSAGPVTSTQGVVIEAKHSFADCPACEFVLLPGGFGTFPEGQNPAMLDFLRRVCPPAEQVMTVCSGSGLLAGRVARRTPGDHEQGLLRAVLRRRAGGGLGEGSSLGGRRRLRDVIGSLGGIEMALAVIARHFGARPPSSSRS